MKCGFTYRGWSAPDSSITFGPISKENVNADMLTSSLKTARACGVYILVFVFGRLVIGLVSRRKSFKESKTSLLISIAGAPFWLILSGKVFTVQYQAYIIRQVYSSRC